MDLGFYFKNLRNQPRESLAWKLVRRTSDDRIRFDTFWCFQAKLSNICFSLLSHRFQYKKQTLSLLAYQCNSWFFKRDGIERFHIAWIAEFPFNKSKVFPYAIFIKIHPPSELFSTPISRCNLRIQFEWNDGWKFNQNEKVSAVFPRFASPILIPLAFNQAEISLNRSGNFLLIIIADAFTMLSGLYGLFRKLAKNSLFRSVAVVTHAINHLNLRQHTSATIN